ncbi:sulfolipid-1 biosynthesis membrane-anchored acyltransferase Chp1 [soil metagenome]
MNRLFVAAVAAGLAGSGVFLVAGTAGAETALIVPGTAPAAGGALKALYHFNPASRPAIAQNYYNSAGADREIVPYPGQLWPVTGEDSLPLGQSVGVGTDNLDAMIRRTDGPVVAAGLSQGTLALSAEQARLANDPSAPAPGDLTFIKAGDPGHLFTKYFRPGTDIPVLDYTVTAPVESQYNTVDVVGQYDIFSDPLDRPGNVLALANAIVAGGTNHTALAFTDPANVAPQDISVATNSRGATTTTYFIPSQQLPLIQVLRDAGMPPDVADEAERVLRPMVDRAYGPAPAPAPLLPAVADQPLAQTVQQIANIPANIDHAQNAVDVATNTSNAVTNTANTVRFLNRVNKLLPGNGILPGKGKR